jgi:class 3 adenylate cyclase/tetratricopeptide (TPR) repeat protein
MRCPSCGGDNPAGTKFCIECGIPLQHRCPKCGAENLPRAKFCGECGTPLTGPAEAPPPHPLMSRPQSLLSYTPSYLAEKILTSKSALEGERKQVTVLFADLKSSMELLADRDPEEARQLLDPVLERMMAAVHRYEGTVNQVMGDGIMALFGAPIAHEDHAVRACYAALAMQEAIRRYSEEVRRTHGLEVHIRVGLNSGEVVVRAIGSDLHMDYSAIGQTTHLAARMEQLAPPGSIRLTAETLRLAEGFIQVNALGPVPVKGLMQPAEVYELVGATAVRRRLQATVPRGLTRFVGRQTELEALRQALERAGRGQGQLVAVVGEPGVGKSRLVYEFVHAHHTQGWLVLESASVSYGRATPYCSVIDLLKRYTHVEERDDACTVRAKVTGQILTLDEALQETLPALLSLLEALPENSPFAQLDPSQRRQRTLEALTRVLLRDSQAQPLVLVFEDLHWIDSETQALLDSLVASLPTARLLLLVNYRPEYQHGWGSMTYYTQLRLDPLPPASADALLHALLGEEAGLQPLTHLLIARTEGNPFFLEESVRTLVETGVVVGEPGAYRLAQALPTIQVPATVQVVLAARIDRLPPEEKRLLQTAAVIGTEVPLPLLQAIAELPEDALHRGLAHLQAAEFLYETRLFPEREYTFKHALTQQVAYETLLQERRRVLHACIVAAIEQLDPDHLADQVERLAHHAFQGEIWEKAVAYLRQAGAKAAARAANREAVLCLTRALGALQHLPESRHTCEHAIDLRLELRYPLVMLGEFERCLQYLREAEILAERLDDHHRLGRIFAYMTHYFWNTGDLDRAIEVGHRAVAIATTLADVALQGRANHALGHAYHARGDYRRALDCFQWNVESFKDAESQAHLDLTGLPVMTISAWMVWCLAEMGAFAEGIARGKAGVQAAEATEDPEDLVEALYGVGLVFLRKGDLHQAIVALERGLGLCEGEDLPIWYPALASALGYAYALAARVTEALPLLEKAVALDASMGVVGGSGLLLTWQSEAHLLAGRPDHAVQLLGRALTLLREHRERGDEAWALRLLGAIAAHRDPPAVEEAEAAYGQAVALANELGMRPLQAHCHFGLGTLYTKIGRREQARTELASAIELYRPMEMTFWLPQAEAALEQVEAR